MPFHSYDSFWNKKLLNGASIASTSKAMVSRLVRQTAYTPTSAPVAGPYKVPYTTKINTDQYSWPVYRMPIDHPRVRVSLKDRNGVFYPESWTFGLPAACAAVPLPFLEDCKPGENRGGNDHQIEANGSDRSVAIICGREMWGFWGFGPDPTAPSGWSARYGEYCADIYDFHGIYTNRWGVRASGISLVGGIITAEDEALGTINHGLAIAIPNTGGDPELLPPVVRCDTLEMGLKGTLEAINGDKIPEGARFRLPSTFDVEAWVTKKSTVANVNPVLLRAMIMAIRDYGLLVADSAQGVIHFNAEDSRAYGTPYHPLEKRPAGLFPYTRETVQHLPWSSMQQLWPKAVVAQ